MPPINFNSSCFGVLQHVCFAGQQEFGFATSRTTGYKYTIDPENSQSQDLEIYLSGLLSSPLNAM